MRILLDECVDIKSKSFFPASIEVKHVKEMGWLGLLNGALVSKAQEHFDVLITIDTNMRFQTSLKNIDLAVVEIRTRTNMHIPYEEAISKIIDELPNFRPATYYTY